MWLIDQSPRAEQIAQSRINFVLHEIDLLMSRGTVLTPSNVGGAYYLMIVNHLKQESWPGQAEVFIRLTDGESPYQLEQELSSVVIKKSPRQAVTYRQSKAGTLAQPAADDNDCPPKHHHHFYSGRRRTWRGTRTNRLSHDTFTVDYVFDI